MKNETKKEIRYFSIFTGVGGFELGLERTNDNQQSSFSKKPRKKKSEGRGKWDSNKQKAQLCPTKKSTFRCIGFSEIDKYCNELLKKRFPTIKNYGDATKIIPSRLPDFNLLVGGFPCQAFSIAGKRRGFEDTRGTLFHEIVRILEVKRSEYILLENVKGLLSHDKGRTFAIILASLSKLGYVIQWMVLNSKFFGVPQNRERVFIIGSLRGEPIPEILPLGESYRLSVESRREGENEDKVASAITQNYKKGVHCGGETYAIEEQEENKVKQINPSKESGGKQPYQQNRIYDKKGLSPALPSELGGDRSHLINTMKIRRLTPIECERLQGFSDNWTEGFSDTQRYKMMGNAITVNVVQAIIERMFK